MCACACVRARVCVRFVRALCACACVRARVCVRVCVRARVRARVCLRVRSCVCVCVCERERKREMKRKIGKQSQNMRSITNRLEGPHSHVH